MPEGNVVPPQWQYNPNESPQEQAFQQTAQASRPAPNQSASEGVEWTASEFMSHQKGANWYLLLSLAAIGLSIFVYFISRDIVSSATMLLVAVLLGAVAGRKPRTLKYHIVDQGVQIAEKFYPFTDFKSFSVINEGAINSVMLVPLKRLAPAVSIYYAPEDEKRILEALGRSLPYEQREQDPIDKFMQRIRF